MLGTGGVVGTWMRPSCCLAFLHVIVTCSFHDRSEEMVTPRYFADLHWATGWPLRLILMVGGDLAGRSWVFLRLGVRPFDAIQVEIRLTSCWRSRMSLSVLMGFDRRMSSA